MIDWRLSWEELDRRFDWVRALRGCEQDPEHHAEGDVWIHTRMVLEALAASPAYGALADEAARIVFAAALLHDVAKPATTRRELDGRWHARGHSTRGAIAARQILWRAGAPFAAREAACALVRHHQVPFFLLEREDPRRLAIEISWRVRPSWLALVAEVDGRGRRCADQQRIVDNVELYRAFCDELGALEGPYPFPSEAARVRYLVEGAADPGYTPHGEPRCEAVLMSGMPGAGKDSWIAGNAGDLPVVSLDDLRRELEVDPADDQGAVVAAAREAARGHLRAGRSFVWNATNLSRALRGPLVSLCVGYGARVRIVYVEAGPESLAKQNRARAAQVPAAVMERLFDRWDVPDATEAHAVEYVVAQKK